MRVPPRSTRGIGIALFAGALLLGGCAYTIPEANPADIPRLEEQLAADPGNTRLRVQLGMAEFEDDDFDRARELLQAAVDSGNQSGAALLYLGMTHEEFEDWPAARDAYNTYLDVGRSEPLRNEVRNRLQLIGQRVLEQQAREALAQEEQLDPSQVTPRSVAVLPFGFNSDREDLQPLIYALSDMMITDFAVSNALTVLERARIQTLLDEMALTEAGYAESETGARAGRLLGAEHVVQGVITTLGQDELQLDSETLNIPNAQSAGSVQSSDQLENLFDIEKDLVFRTLRDVLGIELTPAEEQAILDNRAQNVLAFLAYGRGLRARDQGDYQGALQSFQQAQQLDPSFDAATSAADEATALESASNTSTGDMAQAAPATGETGGGPVSAPPPQETGANPPGGTGQTASTGSTENTMNSANEGVNPTPTTGTLGTPQTTASAPAPAEEGEKRDPVQESQGTEGTTTTTTQIRIVIRAPGGE